MAKRPRRKRSILKLPTRRMAKKKMAEGDPAAVVVASKKHNAACRRVALLLYNTYRLEFDRHRNFMLPVSEKTRMCRWDPDLPSHSAQEWLDIALQVTRQKIDPEDFIRRLFDCTSILKDSPRPADFLRESVFQAYRNAAAERDRDVRSKFRWQREHAQNQISMRLSIHKDKDIVTACIHALDDIQLVPLFRFCFAEILYAEYGNKWLKKEADDSRVDAALEYIRSPDLYDEIWGPEWIPEEFRQYARQAYLVFTGRQAPASGE
ncbi:MAG: hypothetical protein WD768_23205 [Phycisphaeraceae bacterium]